MTLALRYAARTDVGLVRDGNEDSGYAGPHLLAVADGMGGAVAGELASAITIDAIRPFDSADLTDPVTKLSQAATSANGKILARIKDDPRLDGMGTTLTAGILHEERRLGLVHIGDSRAYLLRAGELSQLTHDHTFVQSLVDEGKLTPQQAEHHPHRSLIIRVLDGHHDAVLDVMTIELEAGDWLLFCSDGLGNADIRDSMIAEALQQAATPEDAALELIRKALRAGSPDNVTCVVAEVVDTTDLGLSPERAAVFLGDRPVIVGAAAEVDREGFNADADELVAGRRGAATKDRRASDDGESRGDASATAPKDAGQKSGGQEDADRKAAQPKNTEPKNTGPTDTEQTDTEQTDRERNDGGRQAAGQATQEGGTNTADRTSAGDASAQGSDTDAQAADAEGADAGDDATDEPAAVEGSSDDPAEGSSKEQKPAKADAAGKPRSKAASRIRGLARPLRRFGAGKR